MYICLCVILEFSLYKKRALLVLGEAYTHEMYVDA
jgi:hypothetical protein